MKNKNSNNSVPTNTNTTIKKCKSSRSCPRIMLHELDLEIGDLVIDAFNNTDTDSVIRPMLLVDFHGLNMCMNDCMIESVFGHNDEPEDEIDPKYFPDNRVILMDSTLGIVNWPVAEICKFID